MNLSDLKLFAVFYIKEDEILSNKEKVSLMDFVEEANEDQILKLLFTGQTGDDTLSIEEAGGQAYRINADVSKDNSSRVLATAAATSLISSIGFKINRKKFEQLSKKCEKETGMAKKVCLNKGRRDAIRSEILALNSMKVKCRKTKNSDKCIKNIDSRVKKLQKTMDTIKVF